MEEFSGEDVDGLVQRGLELLEDNHKDELCPTCNWIKEATELIKRLKIERDVANKELDGDPWGIIAHVAAFLDGVPGNSLVEQAMNVKQERDEWKESCHDEHRIVKAYRKEIKKIRAERDALIKKGEAF